MLHFIPVENDTPPSDADRTQEAIEVLREALKSDHLSSYVEHRILIAIHILNKQTTAPCRTLSQLMGALAELLGGSGRVGEEELRQIRATPEERKILEDYGRANGPMPYVPPNAS